PHALHISLPDAFPICSRGRRLGLLLGLLALRLRRHRRLAELVPRVVQLTERDDLTAHEELADPPDEDAELAVARRHRHHVVAAVDRKSTRLNSSHVKI